MFHDSPWGFAKDSSIDRLTEAHDEQTQMLLELEQQRAKELARSSKEMMVGGRVHARVHLMTRTHTTR